MNLKRLSHRKGATTTIAKARLKAATRKDRKLNGKHDFPTTPKREKNEKV